MEAKTFAGFNARPSPWGYNWTTDNMPSKDYRASPPVRDNTAQSSPTSTTSASSPEPQMMANQFLNMPAALLTALKRDKKPFTYTPGGVNLSEVLNQRLQKRIERKKKYSEERMNSIYDKNANTVESMPKFEGQKQLIVMPTYNSPLDMYSMENALEALEVQAELVSTNKSLSSPPRSATLPRSYRFDENDFDSNRGVAQSKAFKVLQIITDTDEEPVNRGKGSPHSIDEMRFTGIRDSKSIPSRFFQTLQKITGTDEDEEEDANPRDVTRVESSRPATYEKQISRPGFLPQHKQIPATQMSSNAIQNQAPHPMTNYNVAPATSTSSPSLKRPAAFLQTNPGLDPLSRVKPVHPSFLANGPRRALNPAGGTDF